ncbi:MAG: flagellar hook assembly protein FlgD [Sphingomonadaceae bacterium]
MSISGNSVIDKLNSTTGSNTASNAVQQNQVDQTTFLKLLTTQMQQQDPFNPVDQTQMVAQMAQFSATAGIAEMNQSMKQMAADIAASRLGDASGWIGRAALVTSDVATPFSDGSYAGTINFPQDVTNANVSLVDANGQTVYTSSLGAQSAGELAFSWSGKDADGNVVANGPLQVRVSAVDADGAVAPEIATWTLVNAVQSPASGTSQLVTGLGLISPNDALRLS